MHGYYITRNISFFKKINLPYNDYDDDDDDDDDDVDDDDVDDDDIHIQM